MSEKKPNLYQKVGLYGDVTFRYWSLAPLIVLLIALSAYPIIQLVRMSFSTLSFAEGKYIWEYSGLQNFVRMMGDRVFGIALRNTIVFVSCVVLIEFVLGMGLALATMKINRFKNFYRTILILPILVPPIAISTIWRLMYNPNFGFFNQIAHNLGLSGQHWLSSTQHAMFAVIIVDVWHWTSYVFLILLAGLQSIPEEPYEAAVVDGATEFQMFRYITWPLMIPTILVALMFRTIFSFKVFDQIFILTAGGPGTATEVVSTYIYKIYFTFQRMGYASALSIIVILSVATYIIFYRRLLRGGTH